MSVGRNHQPELGTYSLEVLSVQIQNFLVKNRRQNGTGDPSERVGNQVLQPLAHF